MKRRQFIKGVLGAAAAVPASIAAASHPSTTGPQPAGAAAGGQGPSGALSHQEQELIGWMRTPPVRQLVAGYEWNTKDARRHHLNKLSLLALGRSESREALAHLLEVRDRERSDVLRRVASIQIYRFERRIAMAPLWAAMIH